MALYILKEHRGDRECSYCLQLPEDQAAVDEWLRRGCRVTGPHENRFDAGGRPVYTITSSVPFGALVSKAEWKQDRLELLRSVALFLGWKAGIPIALALAAIYAGVHVGVVWFGVIGLLCWIGAFNASQESDGRAARVLFWIGTAMAALSVWVWWAGVKS